jgi:hypothetical protein
MQAGYVEDQLTNATLENFVTIPEGITLLDNKVISGISISNKVANIVMGMNPDKYMYVDGVFTIDEAETAMYVIAKKGEVALINKINEIIKKVVDNNLYAAWDEAATARALELGLL